MKKTLLFILVAVLGVASLGGGSPEGTFTFQFKEEEGRYFFDGRFNVTVDPLGAWEVLTDYDHLSRFVANMACRVVKREGDELWVDQTVGGGFLFIRQEVKGLLRVKEDPPWTICLEEVTRRHFDLYQAVWAIGPPNLEGIVEVSYSLQAERSAATPGFVTAGLFRQAAEDLVIGMKKEMDRRENVRRLKAQKGTAHKTGS